MNTLKIQGEGRFLTTTHSRCPICGIALPALVVEKTIKGEDVKKNVVMQRTCQNHGFFETVLENDSNFYWPMQGPDQSVSEGRRGVLNPCSSAGASGQKAYLGKNALMNITNSITEQLATCVALIELTDDCDLPCDTCFDKAKHVLAGHSTNPRPIDKLISHVEGVVERKGKIEMLMLSGGEPTLHPEFLKFVEWACQQSKIEYVVVNTNGKRIALDKIFLEKFGALNKVYDKIQLYMQFDGVQLEGQMAIRGFDIRQLRENAVKNCGEVGIPVTLTMVVTQETLPFVWKTAQFAFEHENVRGVSYQPLFLSGRVSEDLYQSTTVARVTMSDVIHGLVKQSGGLFRYTDIVPLPCGDPNCNAIGWGMRIKGKYYSPSEHGIDIQALQVKVADRVVYRIEDLIRCGCENTALGDFMKKMELKESNALRFTVKPFMDDLNWDQKRILRCCTHVIRADNGKLDSFCHYYSEKGRKALV